MEKQDLKAYFLNKLKNLKRYDVGTEFNGEYIEQWSYEDDEGKYIKYEELKELLNKIEE